MENESYIKVYLTWIYTLICNCIREEYIRVEFVKPFEYGGICSLSLSVNNDNCEAI